jgi:hypothetical protein
VGYAPDFLFWKAEYFSTGGLTGFADLPVVQNLQHFVPSW